MAQVYGLTHSDREFILNRPVGGKGTQRPVARRRRAPGGAARPSDLYVVGYCTVDIAAGAFVDDSIFYRKWKPKIGYAGGDWEETGGYNGWFYDLHIDHTKSGNAHLVSIQGYLRSIDMNETEEGEPDIRKIVEITQFSLDGINGWRYTPENGVPQALIHRANDQSLFWQGGPCAENE